jgi:hypothetical protein
LLFTHRFLKVTLGVKVIRNLLFWGATTIEMKNKSLLLTLALCYLFFFMPFYAYGSDAKIKDILITQSTDYIQLYAKITNCFTKEMESAILAGVPTTFTFLLDLYQERSWWIDKKVAVVVINHTIKYDNIKKIFHVIFSNRQEPAVFQDFESAKVAMAELNGVVVAPVKQLQKNRATYLLVKARLDKVRLPLGMEYVFFFVSLWDFETDWYKQRFIF